MAEETSGPGSERRPNIVLIVTDDQGYGDLSCLGTPGVRTPNLDRLAARGARLTDWYASAPVCSATRAAMLTGQHPWRSGVRGIVPSRHDFPALTGRSTSLATTLGGLGYRCYLSGKWHLGTAEESLPHSHGFHRWFGHLDGCIDYFSHLAYFGMNLPLPSGDYTHPWHDLWEDGEPVWRNGDYMTELITDKALDYIDDAASGGSPFFLYVAYNAPHYPMHAPARYLDAFPDLPPDRRIMAAMLAAMDEGVGRIIGDLERRGIGDDTLIVFTSDNGPSRETRNWLDGTPDPYYGGTTDGLRGGKISLFEGGIRVPGIVCWPGRVPAGQVIDTPCATIDVFPTAVRAAGGEVPADVDGVDLLPHLADGAALSERDLLWEYAGQRAVRRGSWKLVLDGWTAEQDADSVVLSDLAADRGEQANLAASHPDVVSALTAAAEAFAAAAEEAAPMHPRAASTSEG